MDEVLRNMMILFQGGALALLRILGMVWTMPVLKERVVPGQVKVGLSALITFLLVPLIPLPETLVSHSLALAIMAVGELVLGLTLGFTVTLLVEGLRLAGEMLQMQVGLSFNFGDPTNPLGPSLIGQIYYLMAMLIFLLSGFYRVCLEGVAQSFFVVPVGATWLNPMFGNPASPYDTPNVVNFGTSMFIIAAKVAAPIIVTMMIITFVFGLVSRTMPQMNIFIVSYPIRIVLGFLMVAAGLPIMAKLIFQYFNNTPDAMRAVVNHFLYTGGG